MRPIEVIDLKAQQRNILPELERRMKTVLDHGQYIMGPEVKELEEKLAAYGGVKHCIAVASGTDALLIALMAVGIGEGDEVITTPFTFISTSEVIVLLGAKPVFVDIDRSTYNLDPSLMKAAITPKTRAILPVSLYGQCADFDAINAIGAKYGIPVIEDAAQSFGATYRGKRSCALSDIGCTSFFPSKPLGCYGDGGACFTDKDDLATRMRQIRVHGQDRRYHHKILGINGRMDTLQAAVLLAKLDLFPTEVAARSHIGGRYTELLGHAVATPYVEPNNTSVYAQYTVQVDDREAVQKTLRNAGIPTAIHYPIPLHRQPVFAGLNLPEGSFPVAESAAKRVLSIPMHPYLTEAEIVRIATAFTRRL
ncbi:MAG: DegT/DnrJ/EryC1/StrS family aminotransferase [Deltaproteobacteria bacterium]|nr:MAG: DegT/DnrJ/EryC1/StrS family aminotransferase [Deltaproteobacteria bacterium]